MDKDTNQYPRLDISKLFGISIVVGVISIILGSSFNNIWINILFPLITMSFYTNFVWKDEKSPISIEQKADSVYYMGFIFTLVAMTASLINLANSENINFNNVVQNFGLALTTTILGLTVRIIWLQLSSMEISDAESSMQEKIIKRTQELQDSSERIVGNMTHLSRQMRTVSEELSRNFEKLSNSFLITGNLDSSLGNLSKSAEDVSLSVSEIGNNTKSLNPELLKFNENIKDVSEIPKKFQKEFNDINIASQTVYDNFKRLSESAIKLEPQIVEISSKLKDSVESLNNNISSLKSSIDSNKDQINKTRDISKISMEDLQTSILKTAEIIKKGNKEIEDAIKKSKDQNRFFGLFK